MRRYVQCPQGCGKRTPRSFLGLSRVVAAVALIALGGPAIGQQPAASPDVAGKSAKSEVARARALMKQGRNFEALKVLRPLAERRPVQSNVLFLIGLAGIEASQRSDLTSKARDALLDASIEALRSMLVKEPGLVRVRLELGRGVLSQGRGQPGATALRAGAGGEAAGRCGAQRRPVSCPDSGAQALERARGHGVCAGQQYRFQLG